MGPGLFEVGSLELERGRVSIRNPPTQDTCSNDVARPCPPNDCGCRPLKSPGFCVGLLRHQLAGPFFGEYEVRYCTMLQGFFIILVVLIF